MAETKEYAQAHDSETRGQNTTFSFLPILLIEGIRCEERPQRRLVRSSIRLLRSKINPDLLHNMTKALRGKDAGPLRECYREDSGREPGPSHTILRAHSPFLVDTSM